MKAFLLAAGKGTRLRPLTDRIPKCLVPIREKPLLRIWLEILRDQGFSEVLVNTHHFSDQVEDYIQSNPVKGLSVTLFHEPELLGSAGTVRANRAFMDGEDKFLIIYADNLTDMNLKDLLDYHDCKKAEFTMALFRTPAPTECGVAVCNEDGRVVEFQEKPQHPKSDWANAGIYVAGPRLFEIIPAGSEVCDFGFDVLPSLIGTMYGYPFCGFYCDTGTPERLAFAQENWGKEPTEKDNTPC